jgi:hypothetical protein
MLLPDGYSEVPEGKLAAVVTYLQMSAKPTLRADVGGEAWQLRRVSRPDVEWYRALFRRIGSEWLWYSRLVMPRQDLQAILSSADNEVYSLTADGDDAGLLELDFRRAGECELAFFRIDARAPGARRRPLAHESRDRAGLGTPDQPLLGSHLHARSSRGARFLRALRIRALCSSGGSRR